MSTDGQNAKYTASREALIEALEDQHLILELARRGLKLGFWKWDASTDRVDISGLLGHFSQSELAELREAPMERILAEIYAEDRQRLAVTLDNLVKSESDEFVDFDFRAVTEESGLRKFHSCLQRVVAPDTGAVTVYGVSLDITSSELARTQTLYRSELQRLIVSLSMRLSQVPLQEIDQTITATLAEVGAYVGADRAYRMDYDWPRNVFCNTHEWCAEGITPQLDALQDVSLSEIELWASAHRRGLPVTVASVSALPASSSFRQLLEPQGILSMATFPMSRDGQCTGFIGFDTVRAEVQWSSVDISLLELVAQLISNVEARRERELALIRTSEQLAASRDSAVTLAAVARDASEAKSRFVATISHELRTPIHAILGIIEQLQRSSLDAEQAEYVNALARSGQMLADLITDTLDFSRIESGNLILSPSAFDLGELLADVEALIRPMAERKGLELRIGMEPGLERVFRTDPVRLKQILQNLLANAIRFTDAGRVELMVDRSRFGAHRSRSTMMLSFRIADTGRGMDAETLAHLYEPFFQASADVDHLRAGTGLGLTIVHNLVELMGGTISVSSEAGKGTTFVVRIPCERVAEAAEATALSATDQASKPVSRGRSVRAEVASILVAEDNELNRKLIGAMLRDIPCELVFVTDGIQAVAAADRRDFDLIMMDCRMPGLDGVEATRRIRQNPRSAMRMPIIAVTASPTREEKSRCLDAGMDDILSKPFNRAQLLHMLEVWLPRAGRQENLNTP